MDKQTVIIVAGILALAVIIAAYLHGPKFQLEATNLNGTGVYRVNTITGEVAQCFGGTCKALKEKPASIE